MKTRILTAIAMILIIIPFFYSKLVLDLDVPLISLAVLLSIVGLTEMIAMKEEQGNISFIVRLAMYLAMLYIAFNEVIMVEIYGKNALDFNLIPALVILFGMMMVIDRKFGVKDAGFALFAILYIGLSFLGLVYFLVHNMEGLLYLILIAVLTDTFAYFVGYHFGKHKLIPHVSPKKTIEGSLGGTIVATIGGMIFLQRVMGVTDLTVAILLSLVLSIISQFGDLIASKMKREYHIKDYGSLFPGHGGVLDRLDSVLFTALVFYYILQLFPQLI